MSGKRKKVYMWKVLPPRGRIALQKAADGSGEKRYQGMTSKEGHKKLYLLRYLGRGDLTWGRKKTNPVRKGCGSGALGNGILRCGQRRVNEC